MAEGSTEYPKRSARALLSPDTPSNVGMDPRLVLPGEFDRIGRIRREGLITEVPLVFLDAE